VTKTTFFLALLCLLPLAARAQNIYGTSSITIDPSTNTGAADCETDFDDEVDTGYYAAGVGCSVMDSNGTTVASGSYTDENDVAGEAAVTLTFSATPGFTYTVIGLHTAKITVPNDSPEDPRTITYADEYNFLHYAETPEQPTSDQYQWFGPGPLMENRTQILHFPATTAIAIATPQIMINFTGSKSSQDSLTFSKGGVCSESLGPTQCSDYFRYSYEGEVDVPQASQWTVSQTLLGLRTNDTYSDGTSSNTTEPQQPDGPQQAFLQTMNGEPVFWLDSPATPTTVKDTTGKSFTVVNSTTAMNFSVKVCSTVITSVCATDNYFVKIVVLNGVLSGGTTAGQGSTSLSF
jgi:hypothetical protein